MGERIVRTCDAPNCLCIPSETPPEVEAPERVILSTEVYVNAMVYGQIFHRECWEALSGPGLARALGLDDINWCREEERGSKVIYSKEPNFS